MEQKILQCKLTIHNIENKIGQNQAYSSVTPTCTISCGQITDKFMIHCSKCQQWTHYKCTLLPPYQLYMFVNTTRKFPCEICSNVSIRFKQKWDPCVQETFDKPSSDTTQKECDHSKTLEIVNRIEQSIVTALTTIHDSSQEEKIKILNIQIDDLKFEKEKHLSSLSDQMSRLSFDTNVIQSLSKKFDEINASNNNVTEAIKALNKTPLRCHKLYRTLLKCYKEVQQTTRTCHKASANLLRSWRYKMLVIILVV